MAREVGRRCTKCGYQYFNTPKPYAFKGAIFPGHKARYEDYRAWKHCPRCNSTKLETISGRKLKSFIPTAALPTPPAQQP